jgi:hypothetical protein
MSDKEKINFGHEQDNNPEAMAKAGAERSRELHEQLKNKTETEQGNAEELKQEAYEKASSAEKEKKAEVAPVSPAERRIGGPNKAEKEASFKVTMAEVRTQMSAPSRSFSKLIHNKTVEKVSEGVGGTVARPNAVLSGAIFAFALTLGVYLLAKNLGYLLSGFETIAAFVLGWALGIVYDFLKVMVTGRR